MMLSNTQLQEFGDWLNDKIRIKSANKTYKISESVDGRTQIHDLRLQFSQKDDVILIREENETKVADVFSADFIVFINKDSFLRIVFCEVKSSFCEKHKEHAKKQISFSKLFVRYLLEAYNKHLAFCGKREIFQLDKFEKCCFEMYIYPENGQKNQTKQTKQYAGLILKQVKTENKTMCINDGYKFFSGS